MTNINTARTEIEALRAAGETDILVSIDTNGEARWGEVSALSRADMELTMAEIGFSTDGMMTADEFDARF